MLTLRPAQDRGHANFGWLDSRHTFSFGRYYDPRHMGFRALRVINEDRVAAGAGFPEHGHDNMEIVTVVLEGALEHRDSLGNGSVLRAGDVQRMSAGRGIRHSEFNHSKSEGLHFYQIWIEPGEAGIAPGYEEKRFDTAVPGLSAIAAPDGAEGGMLIHADARLYFARPNGSPVTLALAPGRHAWVQAVRGTMTVNGESLQPGDGAALSEERAVEIAGDGEAIVFDLA